MENLKQILALSLVAVILTTTSGFALHSIRCLMTGEVYHSVVAQKCCCGSPQKEESKKCCDDETTVIKLDTEAALQKFNHNINPVFLTAFVANFIVINFPDRFINHHLNYLKDSPPLPEREIIIFVQSFLL